MKKSRKSKIVLLSVLGLATVSLATVGFASWVLNTVNGDDDATFKAEVGDVLTNEVSASITAKELAVSFDNVASLGFKTVSSALLLRSLYKTVPIANEHA